jgi:DNA helicase-2/ATP-dependent DNA helicase PcrA
VVVAEDGPIPSAWAATPQVVISQSTLDAPEAVVHQLHTAWSRRQPVVVRLHLDAHALRVPQTWTVEPYELTPSFTPWLDRLHFLTWANNYDARRPSDLRWAWTDVAVRDQSARRVEAGPGDIVLKDGRAAWLDGGPREPLPDLGLPVVHRETVEAGRLTPMPSRQVTPTELAPDQLAAVLHARGPARVVAPAGSGKTRVLTARLRHLMVDRGYERDSVLAVAFNVRARGEMVARTTDFKPRIQTLNALGYEIVREVRGKVEVIDEVSVRDLLKPLLPHLERRVNTDPLGVYVDALSEVRQRLRSPKLVEAGFDELEGLAAAFPGYRRVLKAKSAVDFDEQLYAAVEALLQDGELRHRWQKRCRHLLVDEFQDLTPLHLLMIRLLALPGLDVFGVGDDDQVLYSYAGADPRYLIDFGTFFDEAAEYALEVNYRCPAPVVVAANRLLAHNRIRVGKATRPRAGAVTDTASLRCLSYAPGDAVLRLSEQIHAWLRAGAEPDDIAVLTRVNSLLLAPQIALLEARVPVNSALGPTLLERAGIRTALAYLRLAAAGDAMSAEDLQDVYRRPNRGLSFQLGAILTRHRHWTVAELRQLPVGSRREAKLRGFVGDLTLLQQALLTGASAGELLALVRTQIGLGTAMERLDSGQVGQLTSHIDDLEAMEQVASLHPEARTFETWLRSSFRATQDSNGVVLATIHRIKGQEWPRVIVYGANEGLMPHRLATDAIEEERRIMHVGLTRGRQAVVVLSSRGNASRFVRELQGTAPAAKVAVVTPEKLLDRPRPSKLRIDYTEATAPRRASPAAGLSSVPRQASGIIPRLGDQLVLGGGYAGIVIYLDARGISLRLTTGAQLEARWGERAEQDGRRGVLVKPTVVSPAPKVAPAVSTSRTVGEDGVDETAAGDWALKVTCPECGAAPGSPCQGRRSTRHGQPWHRLTVHGSRSRRAMERSI